MSRSPLDAALGQRPVHPLDDVAAFPEFAQSGFGFTVDRPLAGADLAGEAELLELAQPPDLLGTICVGRRGPVGSKIDHAGGASVARELAVELCPALGFDLRRQTAMNVEVGARPEFLGDEVARAIPHSLLDVVAGDDEICAVVPHAAHDQMDVRVFRVPVIDSGPIEFGAEVFLHLADEIAGERPQVRHLLAVIGADDEPEVMAVVLAASGEVLRIDVTVAGAEQPGLLSVTGHAFATEISEVRGEWRRAGGLTHDARLDDGAARAS